VIVGAVPLTVAGMPPLATTRLAASGSEIPNQSAN
jgi:hypothetical protein